jgi:hypothetical protein
MIGLPRIITLAREERFEDLLEAVLRNGRALPLQARLRLASADALPGASLGLGTRRTLELTFGMTPQAMELLCRLMERQSAAGSFGSPAATASALGALHAALDAMAWSGDAHEGVRTRVEGAAAAAIESLRRERHPDLAGGSMIGDAVDTLLVLILLGGDERAAAALELPVLFETLEAEGLRHDRTLGPLLERAEAQLLGVREPVAA